MTSALMAVQFEVPLANPAPIGLMTATQWTEETGPLRWLDSGVEFRTHNFGGESAFGVWTYDACVPEADIDDADRKIGERPEFPDVFPVFTSWAADQCDLTAPSRDEVRARAQQVHRLQEPNAVETAFATRLLYDTTAAPAADIVAALSHLEAEIAKTSTLGLIHAGAQWAAHAATKGLIVRSGSALKTPLGNTWVFGGGYVDALDATLVATSPTYGWRGQVHLNDAMKLEHNQFYAVAERSLVIGYEAAIAAATIS